jgi:hypothetical protein
MVPTGISGARQIADESTTHYDGRFAKLDNLTWLPWVGAQVPEMPDCQRLLIVGESHYSTAVDPISSRSGGGNRFTRRMVRKFAVRRTPTNPTFENIGKVLLGGWPEDHAALWSTLSFYNFVQRPMESRAERPKQEDWVKGWTLFERVVRILKPSHCIFIGVTASNSFNWAMENSGALFQPVQRLVKVRRTWARSAQMSVGKQTIDLSFMRHCGAHFSWLDWHAFLKTRCGELIELLKDRNPKSGV